MTAGAKLGAVIAGALAGALAAAPAGADPDAARRKTTPDKFAQAAGDAFRAAVEADQRGDLPAALGLYQKAFAISPHPSTAYNIADVQRRLGQLGAAHKSYETYLALAPDAPDRKDVEAAIAKIVRTPGTLLLFTSGPEDPSSIDLANAIVLVDGHVAKPRGVAPAPVKDLRYPVVELQVPPGTHLVDVITPISFGAQTCRNGPGERAPCRVTAPPRVDGSAVITAPRDLDVLAEPRGRTLTGRRVELAPGRHKLLVRDHRHECPALVVDVAPGAADVTYVHLVPVGPALVKRCRKLDVRRHVLRP